MASVGPATARGDSIDIALLFAESPDLSIAVDSSFLASHEKVIAISFNPMNRWMLTVVRSLSSG